MSEKINYCLPLPVANMQDVATAGDLIAKSGMLGARNPAEGFLIVATCLQEGMSFLEFGEKYNVISGKIALKSEAMLAKLLELGGEYEILQRTSEEASLKLKYKSANFISTLTWEEAQTETYTKTKDGKALKDNWSTPRRRSQMLWARAVSDGVRAVCPLATQGTYTPEEVMDFDDEPINVTPPAAAEKISSIQDIAITPPTPVTFSPPLSTIPSAAQPNAGETPFDIPQGENGVDYNICRAPGIYEGKAWHDVPVDQLKLALNIVSPSITAGDHVVIKKALQEKGETA